MYWNINACADTEYGSVHTIILLDNTFTNVQYTNLDHLLLFVNSIGIRLQSFIWPSRLPLST